MDWAGLIQVNVPIFSAGLAHADVRTAYSRLRQAHLAETGLRRTVLMELRVAVDNLKSDQQQIDQQQVRVSAAREAMRQADAAYAAGLGTNLERLVAQDQLLSAELGLAEAQYNHTVDYLRLMRQAGWLDVGLRPLPLEEKGWTESLSTKPVPPKRL